MVHRQLRLRCSDPLANGVVRQPVTLGSLVQLRLVAKIHPANFSHHFHTDRPMFFSSKIEQKHLSYGGSFRSAATASLACMTFSGFFSDKIKFYKINGVSNCYICILYMDFGVQRFFVGAIYTSHIKNITFTCSFI